MDLRRLTRDAVSIAPTMAEREPAGCLPMSWRPARLGALLTCVLVTSCGGAPVRPVVPAAPCGAGMPRIEGASIVDIPFAPSQRGFAAWVDDHRIVVAESEERASSAELGVEAFVLDVETGNALRLNEPLGIHLPLARSPTMFFTVAGGRLVVFIDFFDERQVGGVIIDLSTGKVSPVSSAGAPPAKELSIYPSGMVTSGQRVFIWTRDANGVFDLDAGSALDVQTGTWQTVRTGLGPRIRAQFTALEGGRLAVWGGMSPRGNAPAASGVLIDPSTGEQRMFTHPAMQASHIAASGSRLVGVTVLTPGAPEQRLRGHVLDVDSPASFALDLPLLASWRNSDVLHFGGRYVGYLGADALHLWDAATGGYRALGLPFKPDSPSDITVHDLAGGKWLFDGISEDAFAFDPVRGSFCALRAAPPPNLNVASQVLYSPRYRVALGGRQTVVNEPDCAPGAPCARDAPFEQKDARAKIMRLLP